MPALTPAAEAIVGAIVGRYGAGLFSTRAKLLRSLVHFGPVRYAQFVLGYMEGVQPREEFIALGEEFERIFAAFPATGYAHAPAGSRASADDRSRRLALAQILIQSA
ncbi:hypothetical protein [Paraburkholderia bannensis]|uniref:hypothetical protein n=1 Tax=Paraburkholderia bannensis TaxID=765414 RepID=UPI0012EC7BD7|nr:hypothetical protein [Paraburkholderia bannensis]